MKFILNVADRFDLADTFFMNLIHNIGFAFHNFFWLIRTIFLFRVVIQAASLQGLIAKKVLNCS
jgi:hypothetical protein